jgi:ubiquinone/menaquinone biosynthesis C-methylase UbiE
MSSTTQVHSTSLNSFNANHTLYDKLRPEFDPKFVAKFFQSLSLTKGQAILELAAGTGKFTRELMNHGYADELIIVDPSEGMLESFKKNFPALESRIGSSYEIPLDDSSVDSVIVAQGFHWFSDEESLRNYTAFSNHMARLV